MEKCFPRVFVVAQLVALVIRQREQSLWCVRLERLRVLQSAFGVAEAITKRAVQQRIHPRQPSPGDHELRIKLDCSFVETDRLLQWIN